MSYTVEKMQQTLLSLVHPVVKITRLPIEMSLGKILSQHVYSGVNVPPHDHSMMDGYAIATQSFQANKNYRVSQRIPAGTLPSPLEPGTIARIFTGAPIPEGADAVIMQEQATINPDNSVYFGDIHLQPKKHIRFEGESIALAQQVLQKGQRLCPSDISLLGTIGQSHVDVYRPLNVVILTTGDELLMPGEQPRDGKIYNANRGMLYALLQQLNVEVIDLGQVKDSLSATMEAFEKAAVMGDVIITTGGVSAGEEDYVKAAIEQLGNLQLWRVDMKPGKPIAFGHVRQVPLIGLPGNPVSAFVTFQLFARPMLLRMLGAQDELPCPIWIEAGFNKLSPGNRREFLRGYLVNQKNATCVQLYQDQGVGNMRASEWGQGLVDIAENQTVTLGQKVAFYPLTPLR